MLTVSDCSSREFVAADVGQALLTEMDAAVDRFAGEPFVLRVLETGRSAYVHPGLYQTVREIVADEWDDENRGQIVFDALAVGQLNVHFHASAASIVRITTALDVSIVVGVDEHSRRPQCVFVPSWLESVLPSIRVVQEAGIGREVESLIAAGDLASALEHIDHAVDSFHSERVNGTGPNPLHCLAGRGHFVARCPCRIHDDVPCQRLRS